MQLYREYDSDEAKLKVYNHRIAQAEEEVRKWHPLAKQWVKRYEAVPNPDQVSGNGHNVMTMDGISVIDSLFSSLTATDVSAMVQAIGQGSRTQEELASAAITKEWQLAGVDRAVAPAVKDSLLTSIGWVKVDYEYDSIVETVPRKDEDIADEVERLIAEAEEAGHDIDAQTIADYVPITEEAETVLVDRIVVDYVPWDMVLFDPTAKRAEDIRWIAQKTLVHPEEVKNNPTYREYCRRTKCLKDLDDLGGDTFVKFGVTGSEENLEDERVTVIELHDFETNTRCTFPLNGNFLLAEGPSYFAVNPDLADKNPFVPLVLRQTSGRVRGISEMEAMDSTLREMDLYRSRLATYLERAVPRYLAKPGAISDSGKEALQSQEYLAVIELEEGKEIGDVTDLKVPTLPAEVYGVPDKLKQELYDATGMNELLRGLFPDRKRTATETAEVVQSGAARQAEKRIQYQRFLEGVAQRILQLMQMFYTEERMARYVDLEGPVEWTWTADDIIFESKLEVVLTPKEVRTWQARADQALAVLNILGPLAQPGPDGSSPVDITNLLQYVLTELQVPANVIPMLLNLPEEQQVQMMEQQQMQAAQVGAQMGVPRADMIPGPLNEEALAAATNQGTIPPEVLAAAMGNTPVTPSAAEVVSESAGVVT